MLKGAAVIQSTAAALLALRCPHCHAGKLFSHPALDLRHFTDMPAACPVCGQGYEPEPGFYWGAMYISYAFVVPVVLAVGLLVYFVGHDPDTWVYVAAVTVVVLALTPLLFRYARAVMLYAFGGVRFDAGAAERGK